MRSEEVKDLLERVIDGRSSADEALQALQQMPVQDMGFARLDTHRELRQGLPEAIYSESKTTEQVVEIAIRLLETTSSPVIATRVSEATATALTQAIPQAVHHPIPRLVVARAERPDTALGTAAVVTAGTSDAPVAEEAAIVAESLGIAVDRIADVGVAGVHRVLAEQERLHAADVVIVVAGMEGALASMVGGICPAPVVAVPTSVGYGAAFEGLAALLAMLNSCAAGVVVTNIDNGFGAACFARRLLQRR